MRDQEHRRAGLAPHAQQLVAHQQPRLLVERAERLVEQDQPRLHHERARDAHALPHAARELRRIARREIGQARRASARCARARRARPRRKRRAAQAEGDVVGDVEPGQRRIVLEHDADAVGRLAGDRPALRTRSCLRSRACSPAISSSSVDLPQPDGPTTAKNSPRRSSRSIGPSACSGAGGWPARKTLPTLREPDLPARHGPLAARPY